MGFTISRLASLSLSLSLAVCFIPRSERLKLEDQLSGQYSLYAWSCGGVVAVSCYGELALRSHRNATVFRGDVARVRRLSDRRRSWIFRNTSRKQFALFLSRESRKFQIKITSQLISAWRLPYLYNARSIIFVDDRAEPASSEIIRANYSEFSVYDNFLLK